jgi:4-carboxymuconolactone decarboxylase
MNSAAGDEMWLRVMGRPGPPTGTNTFLDQTKDHVFGEIWTQPELSVRDRRLISLTCTAFAPGPALAVHVEAALVSGDLDVAAIEAWIVHLAHYAGWPIAANVYTVTRPVLAKFADSSAS